MCPRLKKSLNLKGAFSNLPKTGNTWYIDCALFVPCAPSRLGLICETRSAFYQSPGVFRFKQAKQQAVLQTATPARNIHTRSSFPTVQTLSIFLALLGPYRAGCSRHASQSPCVQVASNNNAPRLLNACQRLQIFHGSLDNRNDQLNMCKGKLKPVPPV